MLSWNEFNQKLIQVSELQIFFIGGAPRSGTTWLQQICDSHPDAVCKGEGLFREWLARPIEGLMKDRARALDEKNKRLFAHTGGYPLPTVDHTGHLIATAILTSLYQQSEGRPLKAIGEKTPENIFLFELLATLFPAAKFIGIARDPRDVLTSAWHFFAKDSGQDDLARKTAFLQSALPSLNDGAGRMIAFGQRFPERYFELTYEQLLSHPDDVIGQIFSFLSLPNSKVHVDQTVTDTSFSAMTKGQAVGQGHFFRSGVKGDWRSTLSPEMNELILRELGWMFPHFGWQMD